MTLAKIMKHLTLTLHSE